MISQMSRGVPEWSGGENLYMGSHHTVTGSIRGFAGIVPEPPKGFQGSTGRSTCPGGPYGMYVEGNQPLSGLGAIPPRAHAPRIGGDPKGGAPLGLGGKPPPLGRRPPLDLI